MKLTGHHPNKITWPDWVLEIPFVFHKAIWPQERAKATEERYTVLSNLMHSL